MPGQPGFLELWATATQVLLWDLGRTRGVVSEPPA